MAMRRQVIFRFFAALPPQELPILLAIIFRPVMGFQCITDGAVFMTEGKKEKLLLSFFHWVQQCNSVDQLFECWSMERRSTADGGRELLMGHWIWDNYKIELPLVKLSCRPLRLSSLLVSLQLVAVQMRRSISSFVPFLGQLFTTIMAQFHPVLEMDSHGRLEDLAAFGDTTDISHVGRVRLK